MGEQLRAGTIRLAEVSVIERVRMGIGHTRPSRVLSAEERMNRMDPFDIVDMIVVIEVEYAC
jgi:hypothetical protein